MSLEAIITTITNSDIIADPVLKGIIAQLHKEINQLKIEVASLNKENTQLREENAQLRKENAQLREENAQLREENTKLREQVSTLTHILFGKSSEKSETEDEQQGQLGKEDDKKKKKKKGKGGARQRRNHDHLPVTEVDVDLSDDQKKCPCCGDPYKLFSEVIEGDTIEIKVKGYKRRIRRKSYVRHCKCKNIPKIITAPSPGKIVPKGSIGISTWVEVLLGKFAFYNPTNRLINYLEFTGISLPFSTIIDGMKKIKNLIEPCYQLICEKNRLEERWNADETGWFVHEKIEGKENSKWYIWVFKSAYTVVYKLSKSRSAETIKEHLGTDVDGILGCDRFSAYKKYAVDAEGGIDLAFCWAHVRRDFIRLGKAHNEYEEWAKQVVEVEIRELYRLHAKRRKAYLERATNPEQFEQLDREFCQKMKAFLSTRKEELKNPDLADCKRKVNESVIEHWQGLTVVIADPETDMDNNSAERALRGPVVGRKNFWGSMMEWSGQLAVMMFTLIQTLLLWGINPKLWLTWYFEECAKNKGKPPADVQCYLPWNLTQTDLENLSLTRSSSMNTGPPS